MGKLLIEKNGIIHPFVKVIIRLILHEYSESVSLLY